MRASARARRRPVAPLPSISFYFFLQWRRLFISISRAVAGAAGACVDHHITDAVRGRRDVKPSEKTSSRAAESGIPPRKGFHMAVICFWAGRSRRVRYKGLVSAQQPAADCFLIPVAMPAASPAASGLRPRLWCNWSAERLTFRGNGRNSCGTPAANGCRNR